ncbi:MAG TPA: hypothetical protein VL282_08565 [Tepidisphaeraceae bacterium]|nr:hypothetical protein [Tepidisphaeraceae bacterium]
MRTRVAFVALMTLTTSLVAAANRPTDALRRYIDAQTSFILEVDLLRAKPNQVSEWLDTLLEDANVPKADVAKKLFNTDLLPRVQKSVDQLTKAGVRHVYWIGGTTPDSGIVMVIPLENDANADDVMKVFAHDGEQHQKIGDAIVTGYGNDIQRLQKLQPADQPELAEAFKAIGEAPVRFAIAISPEMHAMSQQAPIAPLAPLFDNLNWIAMAVQVPPEPSFRLIGQAENPESAKRAAEAANGMIQSTRNIPGIDPLLRDQLAQLTAKAQNDRVVFSFDHAQFKQMTTALMPQIIAMRMRELHIQSARNERQIGMAIMLHINDNKGEWPADLDTVQKYVNKDSDVMINPAATGDDDGYTYIRPATKYSDTPPERMVVYEKFDEFPQEGVFAAFADGHAQLLQKDEFDRLLKDAQDNAADQKK